MSSTASKILAVIIVVVVLLGATIAGVAILNSPKFVAARALENMVTDFVKRDEIEPWKETFTGGSIAFSGDSLKIDDEPVFENGRIGGKLYFAKQKLMLSDFKLEYEDFKIAGDVYLSDESIYVNESEIIDGAYGININTLANDLANSIFAPDSDSEYALEEDFYNKLIDALNSYTENKEITKDAKKLLKDVCGDIGKIVLENAELDSENVKERLNGENKKVRVVTIEIDDKAKKKIIEAVYEYLLDSDDIEKFLEKYQDVLEPLADGLYDEDEYSSLLDAYKGFLEDAEEEVEEMCEDVEDTETLTLKIFTPKHSAKFLKLELIEDKDTVLSIDCGEKGMRKTNKITLDTYGDTIVYEIKENSNKLIDVAISYKQSDRQKYEITLKIDKSDESYVAEYKDIWKNSNGETVTDKWTVKGDISTKGDTTTLTIDSITNKYKDYTEVIKLNCTITVDTEDKMPDPITNYKTVADVTEENIEGWIEKFSDFDF